MGCEVVRSEGEKVVEVLHAKKLGWRVSLRQNPKGSELSSGFDDMPGALQQKESLDRHMQQSCAVVSSREDRLFA